jgi:ATP-dependent Lon protease
MESVEFSGYTESDKLAIARQYLLPRQRSQAGLSPDQLTVDDDAIAGMIPRYTREAGVRQLERELGKVARKVARRIAADEVDHVAVSGDDVSEMLGRPTVHPEHAAPQDQVGIATGLYYTPAGGDIMFVEVSVMPGKDQLVLTGQLGDVMKESARAALSYAKSHASDFGISEDDFAGKDVHVHVPAGAIPKDGPSAGVTMAAALVSKLSGVPVRHDVAMTGEVTLSGRVLPIGGVKEKVLGAIRAGITTIIMPQENLADMEDLREDERERITVHPVESLSDVLKHVLKEV